MVSLAIAVVCAETEGCTGLIMMGVSDNTCGCYSVQANSCQIAGKAARYSFRCASKYEAKTEAYSHFAFHTLKVALILYMSSQVVPRSKHTISQLHKTGNLNTKYLNISK